MTKLDLFQVWARIFKISECDSLHQQATEEKSLDYINRFRKSIHKNSPNQKYRGTSST